MARQRDLDPDPLQLAEDELSAWAGFLRVHATVNRKLDTELEQAEGLSANSYDVLIQLARAPKRRMRMTELADAVLLTPSGLTRLVERLERDGLVTRVRSDDDGRGAYATLTDRGRYRLRKATVPHLAGIRQHFLAPLSREERRLLGDIWKRILATGDADEHADVATRGRS